MLFFVLFTFLIANVFGACTPGVDCVAQKIILGQTCPLTGPSADLGVQMRRGLWAAFNETNAIYADTKYLSAPFDCFLFFFHYSNSQAMAPVSK